MKRKLKQRWSAIPLISNYWINYPHHKNKSKKKKKNKRKKKKRNTTYDIVSLKIFGNSDAQWRIYYETNET